MLESSLLAFTNVAIASEFELHASEDVVVQG
jgi:hypothetical protein